MKHRQKPAQSARRVTIHVPQNWGKIQPGAKGRASTLPWALLFLLQILLPFQGTVATLFTSLAHHLAKLTSGTMKCFPSVPSSVSRFQWLNSQILSTAQNKEEENLHGSGLLIWAVCIYFLPSPGHAR